MGVRGERAYYATLFAERQEHWENSEVKKTKWGKLECAKIELISWSTGEPEKRNNVVARRDVHSTFPECSRGREDATKKLWKYSTRVQTSITKSNSTKIPPQITIIPTTKRTAPSGATTELSTSMQLRHSHDDDDASYGQCAARTKNAILPTIRALSTFTFGELSSARTNPKSRILQFLLAGPA